MTQFKIGQTVFDRRRPGVRGVIMSTDSDYQMFYTRTIWTVKWEDGSGTHEDDDVMKQHFEVIPAFTPAQNTPPPRSGNTKYKLGDRIRDNKYIEVGVIERIYYDYNWRVECYDIKWSRSGHVQHRHTEIDEVGGWYEQAEMPPTLLGRERGRCECGSWAVAGFEGHHTDKCPEFRKIY